MSNTDGHAVQSRHRLYVAALELLSDERAELACSLLESIESGDDDARSPSLLGFATAAGEAIGSTDRAVQAGQGVKERGEGWLRSLLE